MRKTINGKRYDTDKARCIGSYERGNGKLREVLYRKRSGEYFVYSVFALRGRAPKEQIKPLPIDDAETWMKEHLGGDTHKQFIADGKAKRRAVCITLSIAAIDQLASLAKRYVMTKSGMVEYLIQSYADDERENKSENL